MERELDPRLLGRGTPHSKLVHPEAGPDGRATLLYEDVDGLG